MRIRSLILAIAVGVTGWFPTLAAAAPALLLFGGQDHKKFLGCLNCPSLSANSVWNQFGQYGSPFNGDSIWNQYGPWGSPYNNESPWNAYSTTPPVIVDNDGKFYGYFTANQFMAGRTQISWAVWLLDHHDYVIEHLDEVREKFN
jgi:hypothetical protein